MKKPLYDVAMRWGKGEKDEYLDFFRSEEEAEKYPVDGYFYDISLESMRNPLGLAEWIRHLSEKNWFTDEVQARFEAMVKKRLAETDGKVWDGNGWVEKRVETNENEVKTQ